MDWSCFIAEEGVSSESVHLSFSGQARQVLGGTTLGRTMLSFSLAALQEYLSPSTEVQLHLLHINESSTSVHITSSFRAILSLPLLYAGR